MKKWFITLIAAGLAIPGRIACAQAADGTLTEAELGRMVTTWTDPDTSARYVLRTAFSSAKSIDPRYLQKGKVPFRITAQLSEYTKGGRYPKMAGGVLTLYLLDSEGKLVVKKDVSLAKMCPS